MIQKDENARREFVVTLEDLQDDAAPKKGEIITV